VCMNVNEARVYMTVSCENGQVCVAVCCRALYCVLQCVAGRCSVCCRVLQCVAGCNCTMRERSSMCCSVLQYIVMCCSALQCAAVSYGVSQNVVMRLLHCLSSVLQCVISCSGRV